MIRPRSILRHCIGAALSVALASCGRKAATGSTFMVRDSAGVSIAENRGVAPPGGGGWAISAEPTLTIGAVEGDDAYIFSRVWGATRLADGRIAVADNGVPDIRVFDPAGRHLRTFGARGDGPGEFNSPVLMGTLPGDTLVVVDRMLRRLYLFDPETAVGTDRWYYGSQDLWEFQVRVQSGALTRLIRWDRKPVAVTHADVSRLMAEEEQETDDTEQARQFRRMVREAPIPKFLPAYGGIYTDALDYLWVEAYEPPRDTVRATTIFDPDGRVVGSVTLPNHFRVQEIGRDYVLGVHTDHVGVQYLWMYGLRRGVPR